MRNVYKETHTLDERCYDSFALSPEILMEHAALALSKAVEETLTCNTQTVLCVCGGGNNGADGIAAARLLYPRFNVRIFLPHGVTSSLAHIQLKRAEAIGVPIVASLESADLYIDALFGAGLNRALSLEDVALIETLNHMDGFKIACDLPSGIVPNNPWLSQTVVKAHLTVCMGALKEVLFCDVFKDHVGEITTTSLGVENVVYEKPTQTFLLEKKDLALPLRTRLQSNKGSYGHVSVAVGRKKGAALLAARGAYAFGSGLVTLLGKCVSLPAYLMQSLELPSNASVVVAGMGLEPPFNEAQVRTWLLDHTLPLVIDASLCHHPLLKELLNSQRAMVLTPHPKEFLSILALTCKETSLKLEELQHRRFEYARTFSLSFQNVVLVLKGANTLIAYQGEIFINPLGTPSLAKAGSGDVLAGMIGALIAQGYDLKTSAIQASLAHALSALSFKGNNFALTPLDICKGLKWL